MTLRIRMILMNQFDHLFNELENAENELKNAIKLTKSSKSADYLKFICSDIFIAKNRVKEFKTKAIKEFEKRHKDRIKELNGQKKKLLQKM